MSLSWTDPLCFCLHQGHRRAATLSVPGQAVPPSGARGLGTVRQLLTPPDGCSVAESPWVFSGHFPLLVTSGILVVCAFHATQAWQSHNALLVELPCPPSDPPDPELQSPHHRVIPAAGGAEHGARSSPGFPGSQNPSECIQQSFGLSELQTQPQTLRK